jgi:hypothetical protein
MKRSVRAFRAVMIGPAIALCVATSAIAEEGPAVDESVAVEAEPEVVVPPDPEPEPIATPSEHGAVPRVFAELLFVRPTLDDTAFVLSSPVSTEFPNGHRESAEFEYEPAFRIGAGYTLGESGRSVEISYQRLETDATETLVGEFLWATVGHPDVVTSFEDYAGSASARIDADYQQIDLNVTQPWQVSGLDVGLLFGLEWADFRVGERYRFVNDDAGVTGEVSSASRSWGIGPELGLGLGYQICSECGIPGGRFSLSAGSSLALLLTETHTRASSVSSVAPWLRIRDEETSRVITAIHARAGIAYQMPIADQIAASLGVGYQIDTYLDGLTRAAFVDDVANSLSSTRDYDFDLQGIYLALGVVF